MTVPPAIGYALTSSTIALLGWRTALGFARGISRVKRLHQIPCASCEFFTGSKHLKCTLHPYDALTEQAIDCRDYERDRCS